MEQLPSPTSLSRPPWEARIVAALVLVGEFLLFVVSIAGGSWRGEQAPFPYVWRDVAIVHCLCALPLAWLLAVVIRRHMSAAEWVGLSAFFLGASAVPFFGPVRNSITPALISSPSLGMGLRAAIALGLALSAILACAVLMAKRSVQAHPDGWKSTAAVCGLATVVLVLVPATYVSARCRHDVARLGQFLAQSRFGEARTLIHGLLVLDAQRELRGHPLPQVAENIERVVRELESRVAVTLRVHATDDERLDRADQLAMLGWTDAALDVLAPVHDSAADNLRGTIYETHGGWRTALGFYLSAKAGWTVRPPSSARTAGLLQATTGIAYCQRKLGRYAEAETGFLEVLALSPTADSHFLLAQFYEDTQQAEKARTHARHAMALAPATYQQQGEKVINKLSVFHFGCWGVVAAEYERSNATLAPAMGGKNP